MELVLTNLPGDRQKVYPSLEAFCHQHHLPNSVLQAADLALEEHLANITGYAYDTAGIREIRVRLVVEREGLLLEVEDDGRPFNPLERPPVDTSLPLENKPIGGLGIHLIRQFMDDVQYRRQGDKNVLCMRKHLPATGTAS